jgi:hypothetical protein
LTGQIRLRDLTAARIFATIMAVQSFIALLAFFRHHLAASATHTNLGAVAANIE